ncbi:MAG TPA: hypothetical protein PLU26_02220 [Candidatus Competibacter sp.]|nr:hypothetical protein [Candidatus Competibacteraceae bacterium]HUM93279.1 hypothetical protein [Candidatus Competibacter sp.]
MSDSLKVTSRVSQVRISLNAGEMRVSVPAPRLGVSPKQNHLSVTERETVLHVASGGVRLSVQRPAVSSIRAVCSGPPGPPGPKGDPDTLITAAHDLGGHRALRVTGAGAAGYADAYTAFDAVLGISIHAATAGAPVAVRGSGEMVEPSWSWSPGPVYLGRDGMLTQTPPSGGATLEIGIARGPATLFIRIQQEIYDG